MYRAESEIKFKSLYAVIQNFCDENNLAITEDRFQVLIKDNGTGDEIDIRDVLEVYV